jgi:predicted small secreted protein
MITRNTLLKPMMKPITAALLATALLLGGCATVSTVESNVQSFSAAPKPMQPGPFRFERLPSQDQDVNQSAWLEGMAQTALEKAGFSRNDAAARYSVQIGASTSEAVAYPDPFFGRFAWLFGRPRLWHGRAFYASPWPDRELYVTRVRLEIRELTTGKVVYESVATNEESWFNAKRVLPALFEAVMADFPSPPMGVRKVIIKLPSP